MLLVRLTTVCLSLLMAIEASPQSVHSFCAERKGSPRFLDAKLWNNFAPLSDLAQAMPRNKAGQIEPPMPHEMDFPYYSLHDGFSAVLHLVSQSPSPITFSLMIHNLKGHTLRFNPTSIAPNQAMTLELSTMIENAGNTGDDFAEGSASVLYEGSGPMPIVGQITMQNVDKHLIYESRMVESDPGMAMGGMAMGIPPQLQGIWWGLVHPREAIVAVANTADENASAAITLELKGKKYEGNRVEFGPYETKLLSVEHLLSDLHIPISQASEGGITITFLGPNPAMPSLIAQGRVIDRESGFSTTLNFLSAQNLGSNVFDASGVPIGIPSSGSPYAKMGSFVPHVVVRNLADVPQEVALTLGFPGTSGSQQKSLAPITIGSYSTKDISLRDFFEELPLPLPFVSIHIQHSGVAGTLTAEVSSVEQMSDLVVDNHLVNESDKMNTNSGINPWHLDAQTESVLFLTNTGTEQSEATLAVEADGTRYFLTDIRLQPFETRTINLRTLRDGQTKDVKGHVIPLHATEGSIRWSRVRGSVIVGRTLVISANLGVSSNFSCGTGCCPDTYNFTEIYSGCSALFMGDQCQFSAEDQYLDCYNNDYYVTPGGIGWSSSNPSVASISGDGLATALVGGSTSITGDDGGGSQYFMDSEGNCQGYSLDLPAEIDLTVSDRTPNITAVNPPSLNAGTTPTVHISGSGFGNNSPNSATVSITDPSGAISCCNITSYSDTDIYVQVVVGGNAPVEDASIKVTSTGYSGNGFTSGQGNPPLSNIYQVPVNPVPSVMITAPVGIPIGSGTGNFQVNIGSNPGAIPVILKLSTSSNTTGDATFNDGTHQTSLGGSATVPVTGATVSSTAGNLTMQATDPNNDVLATVQFSAVSVSVGMITNTIVGGGTAATNFETDINDPTGALGLFTTPKGNGNPNAGCGTAVEFTGSITPSNYTGQVTLRRERYDRLEYLGSNTNPTTNLGDHDDTSDPGDLATTPSAGLVYDFDDPGPGPNSSTPDRYRANFREYAVLGDITSTSQASSDLFWFSRSSCVQNSDGNTYSFNNDISGDNTFGGAVGARVSGTNCTPTTLDLSGPCN